MRRIFFLLFLLPLCLSAQVPLHWIGATPSGDRPVSFGVPFCQGEMKAKARPQVVVADGRALPTDFWPLAYWGDGSIKWGAYAAVVPGGSKEITLTAAPPTPQGGEGISIERPQDAIVVRTGTLTAYIPTHGNTILDSLIIKGTRASAGGRLVCQTQDAPSADGVSALHFASYVSRVDTAIVERAGGVRAVVKVTGHYANMERAWLPFVVRMYFYAGSEQVRLVHTFTFDGDQDRDFIRALGLRFDVPLREQAYNRHVAFATGEGGVWAESVQPLSGRRILNNDPHIEEAQVRGERIAEPETFDEKGQSLLANWAQWNSYRLTQPNDEGCTIQKRAHQNNAWIGTYATPRAAGYAFVGDVTGGLGLYVKDFWQSYPASLQIDSAAQDCAYLTAYLWSPDAPAMNLRHYDNRAHDLIASYEDVQPGMSTPYGIARTSTLVLVPQTAYPGKEGIARQAALLTADAPLMPTPEYLHARHAFGIWSLPDSSTDERRRVERQLTEYLDYYMQARADHHWYGFWNYGDFMHQYDAARHEWKYDVGGFAWDNTELGSVSWLWYSFLRTARPDLFAAAEAMTRHTSEVDVYHIGPMQGLGSRHNVNHWGCGAKEARISQAAWNRFYYYLTTDERTGDLMTAVRDAEQKLYTIDPMRLALPRSQYPCTQPARLRVGPDWLAYAGNWMTEYERTGNKAYKQKIEAGMKSIAALPHGIFTGPGVLGFDPATGILSWEGDTAVTHTEHLTTIMGGFEVQHELDELLPNKAWRRTWLEYCRDYQRRTKNTFRVSRLMAYAAWRLGDNSLAQRAWRDLWTYSGKMQHYRFKASRINPPEVPSPITESPETTTNDCALWSLEAIFMQEVIPQ